MPNSSEPRGSRGRNKAEDVPAADISLSEKTGKKLRDTGSFEKSMKQPASKNPMKASTGVGFKCFNNGVLSQLGLKSSSSSASSSSSKMSPELQGLDPVAASLLQQQKKPMKSGKNRKAGPAVLLPESTLNERFNNSSSDDEKNPVIERILSVKNSTKSITKKCSDKTDEMDEILSVISNDSPRSSQLSSSFNSEYGAIDSQSEQSVKRSDESEIGSEPEWYSKDSKKVENSYSRNNEHHSGNKREDHISDDISANSDANRSSFPLLKAGETINEYGHIVPQEAICDEFVEDADLAFRKKITEWAIKRRLLYNKSRQAKQEKAASSGSSPSSNGKNGGKSDGGDQKSRNSLSRSFSGGVSINGSSINRSSLSRAGHGSRGGHRKIKEKEEEQISSREKRYKEREAKREDFLKRHGYIVGSSDSDKEGAADRSDRGFEKITRRGKNGKRDVNQRDVRDSNNILSPKRSSKFQKSQQKKAVETPRGPNGKFISKKRTRSEAEQAESAGNKNSDEDNDDPESTSHVDKSRVGNKKLKTEESQLKHSESKRPRGRPPKVETPGARGRGRPRKPDSELKHPRKSEAKSMSGAAPAGARGRVSSASMPMRDKSGRFLKKNSLSQAASQAVSPSNLNSPPSSPSNLNPSSPKRPRHESNDPSSENESDGDQTNRQSHRDRSKSQEDETPSKGVVKDNNKGAAKDHNKGVKRGRQRDYSKSRELRHKLMGDDASSSSSDSEKPKLMKTRSGRIINPIQPESDDNDEKNTKYDSSKFSKNKKRPVQEESENGDKNDADGTINAKKRKVSTRKNSSAKGSRKPTPVRVISRKATPERGAGKNLKERVPTPAKEWKSPDLDPFDSGLESQSPDKKSGSEEDSPCESRLRINSGNGKNRDPRSEDDERNNSDFDENKRNSIADEFEFDPNRPTGRKYARNQRPVSVPVDQEGDYPALFSDQEDENEEDSPMNKNKSSRRSSAGRNKNRKSSCLHKNNSDESSEEDCDPSSSVGFGHIKDAEEDETSPRNPRNKYEFDEDFSPREYAGYSPRGGGAEPLFRSSLSADGEMNLPSAAGGCSGINISGVGGASSSSAIGQQEINGSLSLSSPTLNEDGSIRVKNNLNSSSSGAPLPNNGNVITEPITPKNRRNSNPNLPPGYSPMYEKQIKMVNGKKSYSLRGIDEGTRFNSESRDVSAGGGNVSGGGGNGNNGHGNGHGVGCKPKTKVLGATADFRPLRSGDSMYGLWMEWINVLNPSYEPKEHPSLGYYSSIQAANVAMIEAISKYGFDIQDVEKAIYEIENDMVKGNRSHQVPGRKPRAYDVKVRLSSSTTARFHVVEMPLDAPPTM